MIVTEEEAAAQRGGALDRASVGAAGLGLREEEFWMMLLLLQEQESHDQTHRQPCLL